MFQLVSSAVFSLESWYIICMYVCMSLTANDLMKFYYMKWSEQSVKKKKKKKKRLRNIWLIWKRYSIKI